MTTPKEALRPFAACIFNDNGDITIDTSHLRTEDYMRAKSALASLQGEDAVERVARIVDPDAFSTNYMSRDEDWHPDDDKLKQMRARDKARAILATGLVPDEAVIRVDEREKQRERDARVAEAECYATTGRQIAAAIRSDQAKP